MDPRARTAVEAVLRRHDEALSALDFETVSALWDADDAEPAYLGEEYSHPQLGWAALNAHWARLGARLARAEVRSETTRVRLAAPGVACAIVLSEWRLVSVDTPVERRGRSWVTALLRERPGGWRLFHYAEAPIYFAEPPEE